MVKKGTKEKPAPPPTMVINYDLVKVPFLDSGMGWDGDRHSSIADFMQRLQPKTHLTHLDPGVG